MAATGKEIAEEMADRDLPIPDEVELPSQAP